MSPLDFVRQVRDRKDTDIIEVTEKNRDMLAESLAVSVDSGLFTTIVF